MNKKDTINEMYIPRVVITTSCRDFSMSLSDFDTLSWIRDMSASERGISTSSFQFFRRDRSCSFNFCSFTEASSPDVKINCFFSGSCISFIAKIVL